MGVCNPRLAGGSALLQIALLVCARQAAHETTPAIVELVAPEAVDRAGGLAVEASDASYFTLQVRSLQTLKVARRIKILGAERGPVVAAAIDARAGAVAWLSAGGGRLGISGIASGRMLGTRAWPHRRFSSIDFSPGGRLLALASYLDGYCEVRTVNGLRLVRGFTSGLPASAYLGRHSPGVRFSPDGKLLELWSGDACATFDLNGRLQQRLAGIGIAGMGWAGHTPLAVCADWRLRRPGRGGTWTATGSTLGSAPAEFGDIDSSGRYYAAEGGGRVRLFEIPGGTLLQSWTSSTESEALVLSGRRVLLGRRSLLKISSRARAAVDALAFPSDPSGAQQTVSDILNITGCTMDAKYRLTQDSTSGPNAHLYNYSYDSNDNRLTANESGTLSSWTYDFANRMVTMIAGTAPTTYGYEARGNLTMVSESAGLTTMLYDYENHLKQHQNGSSTATYTYSGDGLKRQEQLGSITTILVWDRRNYLQGRQ